MGFSACLKELRKARGYTGNLTKGRFAPRCLPDGTYNPVQCLNNHCWCVDLNGVEALGTRKVGRPVCYGGTGSYRHLNEFLVGIKRNLLLSVITSGK